MGQSMGRQITFNSGDKPSLMLEYKPSVATESKELCKKPSLDIQIIRKSQFISEKMETFIIDTIIMAKLRHYEDSNQMMSVTEDGSTDVVPQIRYGPYLILGVFGSCMF